MNYPCYWFATITIESVAPIHSTIIKFDAFYEITENALRDEFNKLNENFDKATEKDLEKVCVRLIESASSMFCTEKMGLPTEHIEKINKVTRQESCPFGLTATPPAYYCHNGVNLWYMKEYN